MRVTQAPGAKEPIRMAFAELKPKPSGIEGKALFPLGARKDGGGNEPVDAVTFSRLQEPPCYLSRWEESKCRQENEAA